MIALFETKRREKIEYADGILRGYNYHIAKRDKLKLQLEQIFHEMCGVGSPAIKDPEMAKYQIQRQFKGTDYIGLMEKQDVVTKEYVHECKEIEKVDLFLSSLPEEIETMIRKYYVDRKTYEEIGDEHHMSRETVRRYIDKALSIYEA